MGVPPEAKTLWAEAGQQGASCLNGQRRHTDTEVHSETPGMKAA